MELNWNIKTFYELSNVDLYRILALRNEVFIVEQNCPFQDLDGNLDFDSFHFFAKNKEDEIVAYTRILPSGLSFAHASIGRVVTSPKVRKLGIGGVLMQKSIAKLYQLFGNVSIEIGAQLYLKVFYESLGFIKCSEIYLEDGIEHIEMIKMP